MMGFRVNGECCCGGESSSSTGNCAVCGAPPDTFTATFGGYSGSDACCTCFFQANDQSAGGGVYEIPYWSDTDERCIWDLLHDYEESDMIISAWKPDGEPDSYAQEAADPVMGTLSEGSWLLEVDVDLSHGCRFDVCTIPHASRPCAYIGYCAGIKARWQKEVLAADVPIDCSSITGWTLVEHNEPTGGQPNQCDCSTMTVAVTS
jgi:hypothetical protein